MRPPGGCGRTQPQAGSGLRARAARRERGAAILVAMLTVALVATLAGAALWRQWRALEVEAGERLRQQTDWILTGALDWARLILREDARAGSVDHLGEPWAVPLLDSRLSQFLGIDAQEAAGQEDVFLSGRIQDAQARMNLYNLMDSGRVSEPDVLAFQRLFDSLGLDPDSVQPLAERLLRAHAIGPDAPGQAPAGLRPQRWEQLLAFGLGPEALRLLQPHAVWVPVRTALNLNTAGEVAIAASIPGLDRGDVRRLLAARDRAPLRTLPAAQRLLPEGSPALEQGRFTLASRFFLVTGRLRVEEREVEERSLLLRGPQEVLTVWRERVPLPPATAASAGGASLQ